MRDAERRAERSSLTKKLVVRLKATVTLKKNSDFRRLYKSGKSVANRLLVLYIRRNGRGTNRVGITVTTKLGGAVQRNRVRRRIREIYRLNAQSLQLGYDIVIVARVRARYAAYAELERSFFDCASRLGILSQ